MPHFGWSLLLDRVKVLGGRNNLFHTKTMSPLAITYNDKSVLENMHVASAFEVMQQDDLLESQAR